MSAPKTEPEGQSERKATFSYQPGYENRFKKLPPAIQEIATHATQHPFEHQYKLKKSKPGKHGRKNCHHIRVTQHTFRAAAERTGNHFEWWFVGTHQEFDRVMGC